MQMYQSQENKESKTAKQGLGTISCDNTEISSEDIRKFELQKAREKVNQYLQRPEIEAVYLRLRDK